MGTSKGYPAPTSPQWGQHKNQVTRLSQDGAVIPSVGKEIISGFIRANGGSGNIANGGGSMGGGRTANKAAQKLASFISSVGAHDFERALYDEGFSDLVGKSTNEFGLMLVNKLCEDGSTLDGIDVRNALSDLIEELLEGATNYEDVKRVFEKRVGQSNLSNILIRFFGYYLFHQFNRVHYERLETKRGYEKTQDFLRSIFDTIDALLELKTINKNFNNIDWTGEEGATLSREIMEDTYRIFEGSSNENLS